jgi:FkbM family methyltransferase
LAFAQFDFPGLQVHAFEAQRQVYYMLAGTIALNSLSNVYCHHVAVSSVSGEEIRIPMVDYDSKSNFGSFEIEKAKFSDTADMYLPGKFELLRTIRIDDMALSDVKLLKIDVEGMEDKVIEGARETIRRDRPLVFIETFKTDFDPIKQFLLSLDYLIYMTPARDAIAVPKEFGVGVAGIAPLS